MPRMPPRFRTVESVREPPLRRALREAAPGTSREPARAQAARLREPEPR